MDHNQLLEQQKNLQEEAHQILENINLLDLLSSYGTPSVIGSVDLGLMTWRDIDVEVVVNNPNKEDLAELIKKLSLSTQSRVDFTIINEHLVSSSLPKGIYLGIKYYDHLPLEEQSSSSKKLWKIDIWFLTENNLQGSARTKEIKAKLTPEKSLIILQIKNSLASHPQYRKTIKSSDIYTAVLENEVKTLEEFKVYLHKNGVEI